MERVSQVRSLLTAPEAQKFRESFDEHTVKGALLALMRERGSDPNRPRVNKNEREAKADQPMGRLGYVGLGVHEMAEEVTKVLGRHVGGHEIVHCLYDLQKLGFVTFRTSKNPRLARRRGGDEPPNHGGGNVSGNGIPVNIKLTPRALAMSDEQLSEATYEQEIKERRAEAEASHVAAEVLMNGAMRESAAVAEAEASVALDLEGGAITAKPGHPALVAALMMKEASASVALDRDDEYGTHSMDDGHDHLPAPLDIVEDRSPEQLAADGDLPPFQQATQDLERGLVAEKAYDSLLLARDYPAIWSLLGQESKVMEAVRLLRLANQHEVADLAEEQLQKRTPLEQQVASLIEELTQMGLIRR